MSLPQFDPNGFFQFDLARGLVTTQTGTRVLVLSESVLAPLIATAVRGGDLTAVRELGNQLGSCVAATLGKPAAELPPEVVLAHAAGVIALYGWGRVQLERWGDALALEVEQIPPLDGENLAVAALLGGMFSTLSGNEVACVPVGSSRRYLVVDPAVAERVWAWSKSGESVGAIVSRLTASEGA
jgi:hypothetical protein